MEGEGWNGEGRQWQGAGGGWREGFGVYAGVDLRCGGTAGGKAAAGDPGRVERVCVCVGGEVVFGEGEGRRTVGTFHIRVFEREGDSVSMEVPEGAKQGARFGKCMSGRGFEFERRLTWSIVLVAGLPLEQKVVQYGPFVVTSQEEVNQAMLDCQSYSGGFERAKGWESKIGKSMTH